jgi:hypothetical protein
MFMVPYILVTYVQLKFQLDVFYMYFYSFLFLALHVSGAIALILRNTTAAFSHMCV